MRGADMNVFIKVMKALSDPNRVKILKILQQRLMCVCELQVALRLAQPTVSKHMKILEEAGLVSRQKDGLWVNYTIADGNKSPYAASLMGQLRHWLSDDAEVRTLLNNLNAIHRKEIIKAA
jgi:ArsR family transcriptional regulator